MGRADFLRLGSWNVSCDRTGFKRKASMCRKEWNNLIVQKGSWEPRHPQDFIRSRPDRQQVPDPRVPGEDNFLSTNEVQAEDL